MGAVKTFKRKKAAGGYYDGLCVDIQYRGERIAGNTGATTQAGVKQWIEEQKREIDLLKAQEALQRSTGWRPLTLEEALNRYWEEHLEHKQTSKEASRRWEKNRASKIISALGTTKKLEDLATADIKTAVARMLRQGAKPQSINRDIRPIRAMHNMARDVWEYPNLRSIAWKKAMTEEPDTDEIVPPTIEEVKRLVIAAPTDRLKAVIMFAVLTGMRLDEIKTLQWAGFREATADRPALIDLEGKGRKKSTLPLSSAAISLVLSIPRGPSPLIFDMANFRREWRRARKVAGLPGTRFHDLRHAFATVFRATTKDPMAIKDALRHSDISTSLIYAHADKSHLSPSLEAVATRFSGLLLISRNTSPDENDGQLDLFGDGSE